MPLAAASGRLLRPDGLALINRLALELGAGAQVAQHASSETQVSVAAVFARTGARLRHLESTVPCLADRAGAIPPARRHGGAGRSSIPKGRPDAQKESPPRRQRQPRLGCSQGTRRSPQIVAFRHSSNLRRNGRLYRRFQAPRKFSHASPGRTRTCNPRLIRPRRGLQASPL
jgi:hypothetical protein